ncbi:Keratinocyte-associated protein 3 [Apodemus speciosus]|uniref:Keratinocyte-associated protein 3 n=1 Tax=Apodemus speciosus TaxID=105296 RepID=A0ABQ0FD92_APOSI
MRCCRACTFDAARGPRRLMRVGLALILVGHVNLLVGAVLHGTVLRHVANPRGAVTPEYTTANVISVGSGLLSVSVGLVALLASRNLLRPRLAALSGYCCVAALTLRGIGPCRKEGLQGQLQELTGLELPECKRQENVQLLHYQQDFQALQKTWV